MKKRVIRINEEIQREISEIIRSEIKDPRVNKMVSVLRVETTSDLDTCKVFVSILGNETEKAEVMQGIKSAASFIRRELARRVNLRNTPELKFIQDDSLEYAAKMAKLINEANQKMSQE